MDALLRNKLSNFTNVKGNLNSIERKQGGSLAVKSLHDVVKKEHFILDSEFLSTILLAVPSYVLIPCLNCLDWKKRLFCRNMSGGTRWWSRDRHVASPRKMIMPCTQLSCFKKPSMRFLIRHAITSVYLATTSTMKKLSKPNAVNCPHLVRQLVIRK